MFPVVLGSVFLINQLSEIVSHFHRSGFNYLSARPHTLHTAVVGRSMPDTACDWGVHLVHISISRLFQKLTHIN